MVNRRPKLRIVAPAASAEEAAALVAALERFMRDTAPLPAPEPPAGRPAWARASLLEVARRFDVSEDDTLVLRLDYLEAVVHKPLWR